MCVHCLVHQNSPRILWECHKDGEMNEEQHHMSCLIYFFPIIVPLNSPSPLLYHPLFRSSHVPTSSKFSLALVHFHFISLLLQIGVQKGLFVGAYCVWNHHYINHQNDSRNFEKTWDDIPVLVLYVQAVQRTSKELFKVA